MINKMWQISRTIAMNYQKAFRDIARATFFNENNISIIKRRE